jgi:hypothetical protein
LRKNEALCITKDCTSLSVFMLFCVGIMQLLVETITYFYQCLDMFEEGHAPLYYVTVQEMYLFLSIIVQIGHYKRSH